MSFLSDRDPKKLRVARSIYAAKKAIIEAWHGQEKAHGFSQAALARELGVDRAAVHRRLYGNENMTMRTLAELADAMGLLMSLDFIEAAGNQGQNESYAFGLAANSPVLEVTPSKGTEYQSAFGAIERRDAKAIPVDG